MADATVPDLLARSQWVVRATVRELAATTMREVPASPNTLVVQVDKVLHGPREFSDHVGRRITLVSDDPKGLKVGQSAVFFTRSYLYGPTLAVAEVGRISEREDKAVSDEIRQASRDEQDGRLRERIANASLVVAGKVTDIREGVELRRPIETEHHPDWAEAIVEVSDVLKGKPPDRTVTVVYPRSRDEMWIDSPKFEPGDAVVLILQQDQKEKGWPVLRVPGLTALHPLDRHPITALERVRKLAEGSA
jgi:hypothetical protein